MIRHRWTPSNWASWKPLGIGEQRPNNWLEVVRAVGENREQLGYAWRILRDGVCDGCALGTKGLHDWTLDGVHLCNIRLRLLRLNTVGPLAEARVTTADGVAGLAALRNDQLRELGRLSHPMIRRRGDAAFARIGWDEALDLAAARIGAADPDRTGFFLTSRGTSNEGYYAAQKTARAIGTNNVDNAARVCHSPSTFGLKEALGVGATTCSYADWLDTDLVVFLGSNIATNQPVATKYLHYAKKNGTKIAVVNPYREPGMERYWIPSLVESSLFGTKLADRFFEVDIGGDLAFLLGTLRFLIDDGWVDERFVGEHTVGFADLAAEVAGLDLDQLERGAGTSRDEMRAFARMLGEARRAVLVWSMGITQHRAGEDNVRAIINLALARGFVGRAGCGLMPIRGHSGVQGGAEMGCYATVFPGGEPIDQAGADRLEAAWGFAVPTEPGLTVPAMLDAAHRGELDCLISVGGNFLDTMPDPGRAREALERTPLRVHMDLVLNRQMFVEPADVVLLWPATTRYEVPGGITETSTERRVILSPEIPGRRIGSARPEWEVLLDLGRRVRPDRAEALTFSDTPALRAEIARVVPMYDGIQRLAEGGDSFQYGGERLCEDPATGAPSFPTHDGRAHFSVVAAPRSAAIPDGRFRLSTRRGKQFNSMVHADADQITGSRRESVFLAADDARRLGLGDGDPVVVRSDFGELTGRAFVARVKPGNVQVHWPEGNVLIDPDVRSPEADVPEYTAVVSIDRAAAPA